MLGKWMVAMVVALALGVVGIGSASAAGEAPRVTKEELKAQLGNPTVMILDVRAASDWKKADSKIAGAVREDPKSFDEWGTKYPKDKALVLYCA